MRTLLLLVVSTMGVWGCSCGVWPSAKSAWEDSPVVFLGQVEEADFLTEAMGGQNSRVRVDAAFKGVTAGTVLELAQPGGMCGLGFRKADRLLFYLHPAKSSGKWEAYWCHRTRGVADAADDLLFLRALPGAAGRNRLSGRLEDTRPAVKAKMAGVTVRLQSGERVMETATNADGVFEVWDLVPGTYRVTPLLAPGLKISHHRVEGARGTADAVTMGAADGRSVVFGVAEDNLLRGRVLGPDGTPLRGVCVELESTTPPERRLPLASGCSKEDGTFQITDLPSGTYQLVANTRGRVTPQLPFGAVPYPETVTVPPGEHVERVEFRIPLSAFQR